MDPKNHTFLPILLLFLLLSTTELAASQQESGQSDNHNPYGYNGDLSQGMAVVIVVVIAALFFMGFFTVYIRQCTRAVDGGSVYSGGVARRRITNAAVARGLDPATIETFPTFVYAEVKTQKIGKGALECAICLSEFVDDETLRLLPKCDHVFHPQCIGEWLQGHVTCPVCRINLSEPQQELIEPVRPVVVIETDLEAAISEPMPEVTPVKYSRSHTTGHSVVLPGENTNRFTLKLPEESRKKIMANWKLNRSNSVFVLPRGGSSRSVKPVEPSRARSDRWLFLKTPSFLWRNRDDGSVKLGNTSGIRGVTENSPTGDSVQADRWAFLRNPSFLWRTTPVPSPRVEVNKDGEGTSCSSGSARQITGLVGY